MSKPLIQIDDQVREMNDEEFGNYKLRLQEEIDRKNEQLEKAKAKEALLEKLGITEDEAKLLLA